MVENISRPAYTSASTRRPRVGKTVGRILLYAALAVGAVNLAFPLLLCLYRRHSPQ